MRLDRLEQHLRLATRGLALADALAEFCAPSRRSSSALTILGRLGVGARQAPLVLGFGAARLEHGTERSLGCLCGRGKAILDPRVVRIGGELCTFALGLDFDRGGSGGGGSGLVDQAAGTDAQALDVVRKLLAPFFEARGAVGETLDTGVEALDKPRRRLLLAHERAKSGLGRLAALDDLGGRGVELILQGAGLA